MNLNLNLGWVACIRGPKTSPLLYHYFTAAITLTLTLALALTLILTLTLTLTPP